MDNIIYYCYIDIRLKGLCGQVPQRYMLKSEFYYDLPQELIAQTHAVPRDHSRMMVLDRITGATQDLHFYDLPSFLREGDVLVRNNSKVIPARLLGQKDTGAHVEILLLKQTERDAWECLVRPGKRLHKGTVIDFHGKLKATIGEELTDGKRKVFFDYDRNESFFAILDEIGRMPTPPYITKELEDNDEYQTVYAEPLGSAAAPTAGLHFTNELLDKVRRMGVQIADVTLHVGLGTFRPVKEEVITDHIMHSESYSIDETNAEIIRRAKEEGRRVICTGTTSCRTVEAVFAKHGEICACHEDTDIFIYPGYRFNVMDGLITNFHLPESTLIMLVSAFAGYENTMNAYRKAVENRYRFFSFGDSMLII